MFIPKALLLLAASPLCLGSSLPIVDLGYELHQAISLNESQGVYNFSNVRFAAPPLGDRRFRAPVPPEQNRSSVQTGDIGRICPQASPIWSTHIATAFVPSYLDNKPFNGSLDVSSYPYDPPKHDPRTTEDCLFLDVVVPKSIFDKAQTAAPKLAPVLVWIYGGGYVGGEKSNTDASGLIKRSFDDDGEGIVYVALNYRLGVFGWLTGHSLTANGTANAALHDQRLGLDWVYKYIHLFGGDPERVTVMGESAGGGSIMHQITAYGGKRGPVPFQQAIMQSPGWFPVPSDDQQEDTLQEFLGILDVNTVDEARALPSDKLIAANSYQVAMTQIYGTFTYGPVVDGTFVPEMPGKLLLQGDYDHNIKVMVGHNANEGLLFTSPASLDDDGYDQIIEDDFPDMPSNVAKYATEVLYPAVYNGSYGYKDSVGRLALSISDVVFQCNGDYFNQAFNGESYSYMFSVPPSFHGMDVPYTFYHGGPPSLSVLNTTVAQAMQDYITSFAQTGVPKSAYGPPFEKYGDDSRMLDFGLSKIAMRRDPTDNVRCQFWRQVPYYSPYN